MVKISIEKIDNGFLVRTDYGMVLDQSKNYVNDSKEFAGNADAIRDCLARVGIKLQNVDWVDDSDDTY